MRILFLCTLLLLATPVYAQEGFSLTAEPINPTGYRVSVWVQSTQQSINAVEGVLQFAKNTSVTNIETGGSVTLYFVEPPTLTDTQVSFSGIMPGGFTNVIGTQNGAGFLFSVDVDSTSGSAQLQDVAVYLNDGEGTRIPMANSTLSLEHEVEPREFPLDTTLPEWVRAERAYIDTPNGVQEMLVLSAIDKESGVSHFEVRESGGVWVVTQTPYLIQDTSAFNRFDVRAVDYAGNVRQTTVRSIAEDTIYRYLPYLGILVLLSVLLVYLWKRFRKHST